MTEGTKALFVRVRDSEGKYLAGAGTQVEFTDDINRARIFDCRRAHIEMQLEYIRLTQGIALQAEPVDPKEIYEICDGCGRLALSFDMFFDGKCYLCEECRGSIP